VGKQGVLLEDGVDVALVGGTFETSAPSSRILPDVGSSKPAIILSRVVLPQPDGPSIEKNSPRTIPKSASSTATNVPNSLRTASRTMTSSVGAAGPPSVTSTAWSCLVSVPVMAGS
jgi:hypothetical protein